MTSYKLKHLASSAYNKNVEFFSILYIVYFVFGYNESNSNNIWGVIFIFTGLSTIGLENVKRKKMWIKIFI